jgi:NTE family protein
MTNALDFSTNYKDQLLRHSLKEILGDVPERFVEVLAERSNWIEITGGSTLFREGDAGDSFYCVISGRLKSFIYTEGGIQTHIGDIVRGETVGEMAIFTGEPRMATVVAARDSVLIQLLKADFEDLVGIHPQIAVAMSRNIIQRLKKAQTTRQAVQKFINICLVPISPNVSLDGFSSKLATALQAKGKTKLLDSPNINTFHKIPDFAQTNDTEAAAYHQLTSWLDEEEAQHDFMLFVADPSLTEWTKRCIRTADVVYFVADATQNPQVGDFEKTLTVNKNTTPTHLILLHSANSRSPKNTAAWYTDRNLTTHVHLRPDLNKDMERLARIMSGTAVGLVLAGGGAKGFAHLGVYQALMEAEIPIDFVGGTSMGALLGIPLAMGLNPNEVRAISKKSLTFKPTSDYAFLPFMSLIKGRNLNKVIEYAINDLWGFDADTEDTWLNYYAVSSNFTQAREEVHQHGRLRTAIRASISIPGVFPPVVHGTDLLIDGGTFNNFPTDVMYKMGAGKILGVDLSRDKIHSLTIEEIPSTWEMLRDKFKPKRQRRYRLPSLMSILLNTTMLYSTARKKEAKQFTDVYFNPNVAKYGLLDWGAFDKIYDIGYDHAREVLGKLSAEELAALKG